MIPWCSPAPAAWRLELAAPTSTRCWSRSAVAGLIAGLCGSIGAGVKIVAVETGHADLVRGLAGQVARSMSPSSGIAASTPWRASRLGTTHSRPARTDWFAGMAVVSDDAGARGLKEPCGTTTRVLALSRPAPPARCRADGFGAHRSSRANVAAASWFAAQTPSQHPSPDGRQRPQRDGRSRPAYRLDLRASAFG